ALEQQEGKKNVLWSDEKYFCLIHPNLYQYVWRMPHEEFDDDCLVLAIKSKGVMMWGYFSWWGPGPLVPSGPIPQR
ncbi:20015_t:CDS:2, partial [Racocetra persica]